MEENKSKNTECEYPFSLRIVDERNGEVLADERTNCIIGVSIMEKGQIHRFRNACCKMVDATAALLALKKTLDETIEWLASGEDDKYKDALRDLIYHREREDEEDDA